MEPSENAKFQPLDFRAERERPLRSDKGACDGSASRVTSPESPVGEMGFFFFFSPSGSRSAVLRLSVSGHVGKSVIHLTWDPGEGRLSSWVLSAPAPWHTSHTSGARSYK